LIRAAGEGHTEMLNILIDKGADMTVMDMFGNTALICVAKNGRNEALRELLKRGADINVSDSDGNTALTWAEDRRHTDLLKY